MNLRKGSLPIWLLPWGNNKYLETAGEGGAERLAPNLPTGETVEETDLFKEEIIPSEANREVPAKIKDGAEGHNIKTYTRYIPEGNAGRKRSCWVSISKAVLARSIPRASVSCAATTC